MKISFIGGGNMASTLLEGCLAKGFKPSQCHVVEINAERREFLGKKWQIPTESAITPIIQQSDVILLAVKPQQMQEVATALKPYVQKALIISIAAGIRLDSLHQWLSFSEQSQSLRLVRAMPNMAALVHQGITGLSALSTLTSDDRKKTEILMNSIGDVLWVDNETQLDAITAVSGSGPAYVFYLIEALQQAAEILGLSSEQSRQLALKTFEGASHLAAVSSESVSLLREKVTSKGGTTEAALKHLEKMNVKQYFIEAVQAANHRAKELGKSS